VLFTTAIVITKMKYAEEATLGFRMSSACVAGFSDNGEMWRNEFETERFVEDMQELWQEVEPLYLELHTYVKQKLKELYKDKMADDDLIPAHILGSLIDKR
jgi:hypothetical protein